jgi:probable rRNA maturation factor
MFIDLNCEEPRWGAFDLERIALRAVAATLLHLGMSGGVEKCEISLLACDDARIAALNAGFRDRDRATNVLSWPATDLAALTAGALPERPEVDFSGEMALGDIAIAWETCAREAQEAGIPMGDHVTHLLVHGVLHLLGYDHIRDPDATLMMENEIEILGKLGISDPYKRTDRP